MMTRHLPNIPSVVLSLLGLCLALTSTVKPGQDGGRVYIPESGALYELGASGGRPGLVSFSPGERVLDTVVEDAKGWKVTRLNSKVGERVRHHLVVKPQKEGARTTIVVTTSLGSYTLVAMPVSSGLAPPSIAFRRPFLEDPVTHTQGAVGSLVAKLFRPDFMKVRFIPAR